MVLTRKMLVRCVVIFGQHHVYLLLTINTEQRRKASSVAEMKRMPIGLVFSHRCVKMNDLFFQREIFRKRGFH